MKRRENKILSIVIGRLIEMERGRRRRIHISSPFFPWFSSLDTEIKKTSNSNGSLRKRYMNHCLSVTDTMWKWSQPLPLYRFYSISLWFYKCVDVYTVYASVSHGKQVDQSVANVCGLPSCVAVCPSDILDQCCQSIPTVSRSGQFHWGIFLCVS